MKTTVPAGSCSKNRTAKTKSAPYSRSLLATCLTIASLVLLVATTEGITRPPFVGFIPDQRISSGSFTPRYFRIFSYEIPSIMIATPTVDIIDNSLPGVSVSVAKCMGEAGCANDGTGYKVTFTGTPSADGFMVVRVKARNMGVTSPYGYTSFILRRDASGTNPPRISNLPNRTLQLPLTGQTEYDTMFVIGDLTENVPPNGAVEDFQSILLDPGDAKSYNTSVLTIFDLMLLPSDDAYVTEEGPRDYLLTAKTPLTGAQPGVATLKVDVTDPDMPSNNTTSGSCVVQVSANSNAIPSFNTGPDGTYLVCPVPTPNPLPQYHYVVASNDLTSVTELRCQATSSNTLLVPNDSLHLSCSPPDATGMGTVSITPLLPLPTPGIPQATTITLTVTDDLHTRQSTFLYIVNDPTSPALAFSRPSGVYSLDPDQFHHRDPDKFLTGEMHAVRWAQVEQGLDNYVWGPGPGVERTFNGDIAGLPLGQDLSLNLQQEPCYIAQDTNGNLDYLPWCDTDTDRAPDPATECDPGIGSCTVGLEDGYPRAVPWDTYLWERRDAFLDALHMDLALASVDRLKDLSVINTNLPGGFNGIRNTSIGFQNMTGYTRENLLRAIQHELRTVQDKFPGVLVQIGFFLATDGQDSQYGDKPLWQWLYKDASSSTSSAVGQTWLVPLFDEFNGVKRPRVSFFQEDLAANRTSTPTGVESSSAPNYVTPAATTAYTLFPDTTRVPSFAYPSASPADKFNNGITMQANTPWSNPFIQNDGDKLTKTFNGSPNDGIEGAFNTYHGEYLEVYLPDIDHAHPQSGPATVDAELWESQLQSWHDYLKDYRRDVVPIEPPAGLDVVRTSGTDTVSWFAVHGAATYKLQQINFSIGSPTWTDVVGCNTAMTSCMVASPAGNEYGYRVRALNAAQINPINWTYTGVFVSYKDEDGYIQNNSTTNMKTVAAHAIEPGGIQAGRGITSNLELRGFLSFRTGALGTAAKILGARLRIKQTTDNTGFDLGGCKVDIKKGAFNNNPTLMGTDFSDPATHPDVMRVTPLDLMQQTPPDWTVSDLRALYKTDINTDPMGMSAGRTQLRLYFAGMTANKLVKWNATDSVGNEPYLLVQYTP